MEVPAVAVTSTGKTEFFGNGKQSKYIRRKFKSKRRKLGKAKKLNTICKLNDKEQRWIKDQNHKISHGPGSRNEYHPCTCDRWSSVSKSLSAHTAICTGMGGVLAYP